MEEQSVIINISGKHFLRSKAFGGSKKPKYLQEYICEEENNEVTTFEVEPSIHLHYESPCESTSDSESKSDSNSDSETNIGVNTINCSDIKIELQFDEETNDFIPIDCEEKPFLHHHTTTIAILLCN